MPSRQQSIPASRGGHRLPLNAGACQCLGPGAALPALQAELGPGPGGRAENRIESRVRPLANLASTAVLTMHPDDLPLFRRLLAMGVLAFAAALVWLAWPRLHASVLYLPVDTALARFQATREMPAAQIEGLLGRVGEVAAIHPHYRYLDGASRLHYLRAREPATAPWLREPALHQAVLAAEASLRRAPAQPYAWLRIAQARAARGGGAPESVVAPLKMSVFTGRVEPTLLLQRVELGYAYLPQLDAEARALLRDQTVLAWRVDERGFRARLAAGAIAGARLREVLGETQPAILDALEGHAHGLD